MIRVGVFSDSHGDRDALEKLLDKMGHIDARLFSRRHLIGRDVSA